MKASSNKSGDIDKKTTTSTATTNKSNCRLRKTPEATAKTQARLLKGHTCFGNDDHDYNILADGSALRAHGSRLEEGGG